MGLPPLILYRVEQDFADFLVVRGVAFFLGQGFEAFLHRRTPARAIRHDRRIAFDDALKLQQRRRWVLARIRRGSVGRSRGPVLHWMQLIPGMVTNPGSLVNRRTHRCTAG